MRENGDSVFGIAIDTASYLLETNRDHGNARRDFAGKSPQFVDARYVIAKRLPSVLF
ncbi:MAG: hypothetical protein K2G93_01505 [Rikenella sp.]|nr:hypothetical protein [Rikenella sp.]